MCFYILKEIAVIQWYICIYIYYAQYATVRGHEVRNIQHCIPTYTVHVVHVYVVVYATVRGHEARCIVYQLKFGYYWDLDVGNLFGVNIRRTRSLNVYLQTCIHAHSQADSQFFSTFFLGLRCFCSKLIVDMQFHLW